MRFDLIPSLRFSLLARDNEIILFLVAYFVRRRAETRGRFVQLIAQFPARTRAREIIFRMIEFHMTLRHLTSLIFMRRFLPAVNFGALRVLFLISVKAAALLREREKGKGTINCINHRALKMLFTA